MPAGSRPRKRTAAAAAASTGDPATITSPLCSNSASAPSSAGQVSHVESSTGSGAGSGSDTAPQQQQQQQSPVGQRAADHIQQQQDDAEGAPPKRKRGRPRKLVYFVSNTNILNESHADDEDREYEKLRKINHNVIERRRRDQINQSITELAEMLPMSIHQGAALNKLNTLKLSVDFVRQLTAQNQDLLVERQVMRTMLHDRGVDWKTVEVAIAEHRAQMSASAAEQQAQQHLEYQHQSGLPRLLPSTDGGRVAVAASKVQAQQLQQQQQHSVGAESAGSTTQSGVGAGANGAMGTVEQQQPGHFTPTTTTGFVANEGRWLPNTTGYPSDSTSAAAPVPLLPAPSVPSSFAANPSSSIMFGRVAAGGNTPPSTPGSSPRLPPQPAAVGGGLAALASVACAMDASAPPSPAVSITSVHVTGNAPLRLPPPSSSSLSLPLPNSSVSIGSFAQPVQDQRQQMQVYQHQSPFHPLNTANHSQRQQHTFSSPSAAASSPIQPQQTQLAPAASSYPTSTGSSVYSLPPTVSSSATGYAVVPQPVQYQRQSECYPTVQGQQPQQQSHAYVQHQEQSQMQQQQQEQRSHMQQQPHQQQYFYYSAPHSRQLGNANSVSASPMVGTGGVGTWTSGPGFLN